MTDAKEDQSKPRVHSSPTRRAWIMRGIVTPIFGLIAVACFIFGALNSTIWKPDHTITADAGNIKTRYVMVDPGVLNLVDPAVTLSVQSGNTSTDASQNNADSSQGNQNQENQTTQPKTCIAVGSSKDATGWLAGEPYTRITGLTNWQELAVSEQKAQGQKSTSENQVPFADSNMWESVQCGDNESSIKLNKSQTAQVALIDFGTDVTKADVTLSWTRQNVPNFALPWYFTGGLFAVLAVLCASVFAMNPQQLRKRVVESAPAEASDNPEETTIREAVAGSFSSLRRKRGRRRHARHSGAVATEQEPTVIDPAARNMVAERAQADSTESANVTVDSDVSDATTSVISTDELNAYFARLAQEVGVEPAIEAEPAAEVVEESVTVTESEPEQESAKQEESAKSEEKSDAKHEDKANEEAADKENE